MRRGLWRQIVLGMVFLGLGVSVVLRILILFLCLLRILLQRL